MALAIYQRTIVDDDGNILPGASVEVRTDPGNTLATIYSDRDGSTPISNPTVADVNGKVTFFAVGGAYKITATFGALNIVDRYQAIGTMAEFDIETLDSGLDTGFDTRFGENTIFVEATGVGDDYPAFLAAWNAANAALDGCRIVIPPGSFTIGTQLPILTGAISIVGGGKGVSRLKFNHAGVGLRIEPSFPSGENDHILVSDFALGAANAGCTVAIECIDSDSPAGQGHFNLVTFRDLFIGFDGGYWEEGLIYVKDIQRPYFERIDGHGRVSCSVDYGILVDGFCVSPTVIGCELHFFEKAIRIEGTCEGAYMYGNDLLSSIHGIWLEHPGAPEPWTVIQSSHIACYQSDITCKNLRNLSVRDCDLRSAIDGGTLSTGWRGIHLLDVENSYFMLFDNHFVPAASLYPATTTCIEVAVGSRGMIGGGHFRDADNGIILGASASNITVTPSKFDTVTTPYTDSGTGNIFFEGDSAFKMRSAGLPLTLLNTADSTPVSVLRLEGDRATPANSDAIAVTGVLSNASGTQYEFSRVSFGIDDVTAGGEDGHILLSCARAGALSHLATVSGLFASIYPVTNDGCALGIGSRGWSDLHLASGALINAANGNAVITHSSGVWTVSTGDLRVTTAGTNTASAVTVGGAQTLTGKTLTTPNIDTINLTGGQIAFPASQNASADPNTFDDYEEGTFTPTLGTNATQPTGVTYTTQVGNYTKVGRIVLAFVNMTLSSKGSGGTGAVRISGLPFTAADPGAAVYAGGLSFSNITFTAGYTDMSIQVLRGATTIGLQEAGSNVAAAGTTWANFTNTTAIFAHLFYYV